LIGLVHAARRILSWLGFHGLLVLCLVLVVVGGTWGFVELLDEVDEGDTRKFDQAAIDFAVKYHGPQYKWLEEIGRDLTALGGIVPLTLITSFVVGYLLIIRKYGAMWLMLAAVVGGMLISFTLKRVVDRERPPDEGERLSHVYTKSFPSGHSMMSMVVYLTLGSVSARFVKSRTVKAYLIGSALFISFLVGVSRVYMAVHWPTDVLAGWTAGLVWAILCWLVATYLQRRRVVEQEGEGPSDAEVDEPLTVHDVND
jgi:undecaprenyl-diphosphatase